MNAEERRALFDRCLKCMDGDSLSGWFPSTSSDKRVQRENVIDWLHWSLFSTKTEHTQEEWKEELERYLSFFDGLFGYNVELGRNQDMTALRLSIDPVVACHRPLLWYGVRIELYSMAWLV